MEGAETKRAPVPPGLCLYFCALPHFICRFFGEGERDYFFWFYTFGYQGFISGDENSRFTGSRACQNLPLSLAGIHRALLRGIQFHFAAASFLYYCAIKIKLNPAQKRAVD